MATKPKICNDGALPSDGFLFNRNDLSFFNSSNGSITSEESLSDIDLTFYSYAFQKFKIKSDQCKLLDLSNTPDINGLVRLIIIRVTYPDDVYENKKFITFQYKDHIRPIGKLCLLTGSGGVFDDSSNQSENFWDFNAEDSSYNSAYFSKGGFILCNSNTFDVKVEVLIAN